MSPSADLTTDQFPRLLYLADVPVENTYAGGALLYRLLKNYPPWKLLVICPPTAPGSRLPGVSYRIETDRWWPRLSRTRFSTLYALLLAWWRSQRWKGFEAATASFSPQAVMTVAQSATWMAAWKFARRARIPLYLVTHDDGNYRSLFPAWSQNWAERQFALAYREATVRYCVSPRMAEIYNRRYGATGTVLLPCTDPANTVYTLPAPQTTTPHHPLQFAYAGSLHGESNLRQIAALATALGKRSHRLVVFTPDHAALRTQLGDPLPTCIQVEAPLPPDKILPRLRELADVLVVIVGFSNEQRAATETLFNTKVADYSVVGLPVLIHAPPYAAVTAFFRQQPGAAEMIDQEPDSAVMHEAIQRLEDPAHRSRLATSMLQLGQRLFSSAAAWQVFRRSIHAGR